MSDEPAADTRTGAAAVDGLVSAVRTDMGTACDLLERASAVFAEVARRGRGVNGLAVACNGFRDLLGGVIASVAKEVADVERKYNGNEAPEPMHEDVDEEHLGRVKAAKQARAEAESLAARTATPEQQQSEEE